VYKILKLAALLVTVTLLATGCANRATATVSPSSDLSALKTMHVKHFPSDNSGVNMEIADRLRSRGIVVTTGTAPQTGRLDAIVTYRDKWMWDITMYMLELTIDIRDPRTEAVLATGNSYHTSLTRLSQTAMVNEVVDNIFNSARMPASVQTGATPPRAAVTTPVARETQPDAAALASKLEDLAKMRKAGVITEEEYVAKRKQLIEKF
jgi:hypothetical protein